MIKIDPLLPTDSAQELLGYEEDLPCSSVPEQLHGLTFWQHWLPCNWHMFPSAYVAREDGAVIGLIVLSSMGKSRSCWRIDHLVVHPEHRGRGLAVELLRYVFALFGGQGVSHFAAYASDTNSTALRLFGSCGFKRAAKLTAFSWSDDAAAIRSALPTYSEETPAVVRDTAAMRPARSGEAPGVVLRSAEGEESVHAGDASTMQSGLRRAVAADSRGLFQIFQDVLPTDIRVVFNYGPGDFKVIDSPSYNKVRNKLLTVQPQYWLWQDPQRQTITSAVKVVYDRQGNAQLEFAVHPGWKHQACDFVRACLQQLKQNQGLKSVTACVFDFDTQVAEALKDNGMEITGHSCLLTREHWVRAKKVKRAAVGVPSIAKPAINFPV